MRTKQRLFSHGIGPDCNCAICGSHEETTPHLFFNCRYRNQCISNILNWLQVRWRGRDAQSLWRRVYRDNGINNFRRQVIGASLAATVYHVWLARNDAVWQHKIVKPKNVCVRIKTEVLGRIRQCLPKRINYADWLWFNSL